MTTRAWHKGPPPHIGWWNASINKADYIWRWWDGSKWSNAVSCRMPLEIMSIYISYVPNTFKTPNVLWSDYYPKNARVPRIDPRNTK